MKFVDEIIIEVTAGSGGRGCMSFRREKYIPFGGPDGGNGGKGGSVFLVGDGRLNNLLELRNKRFFSAESGMYGTSKLKHGKAGENLYVPVPCGTRVFNVDTDELIADVTADGQQVCVALGADGGFGNAHFKSSTNRAPRRTTLGFPGEYRKLRLELTVLADVGLLGLPNAGKSTLLRQISRATPKVADYPFTTLRPYIGVVEPEFGTVFTVADIPGLIEGAADGAGLGVRFLKHLSRCRLLLHLVDMTSPNVLDDIMHIRHELQQFSDVLAKKPIWLVVNKIDVADEESIAQLVQAIKANKAISVAHIFCISAIAGKNIQSLLTRIAQNLAEEVH